MAATPQRPMAHKDAVRANLLLEYRFDPRSGLWRHRTVAPTSSL
jgi:hypothetical protein